MHIQIKRSSKGRLDINLDVTDVMHVGKWFQIDCFPIFMLWYLGLEKKSKIEKITTNAVSSK